MSRIHKCHLNVCSWYVVCMQQNGMLVESIDAIFCKGDCINDMLHYHTGDIQPVPYYRLFGSTYLKFLKTESVQTTIVGSLTASVSCANAFRCGMLFTVVSLFNGAYPITTAADNIRIIAG